MRLAPRAAMLLAVWILAWGDLSIANVVTGLALAGALLAAFPPRRRAGDAARVNPIGFAHLVLYVAGQLITSNVLVAREVLSRRSSIRTGVLAYPVPGASDELLSLVAHVIGLTPGTMTVEATRDPAVIYVHFLLLADVEKARRDIAHIERLARAVLREPDPSALRSSLDPGGPG
jgi:multicomponent Na+:H+ antiporter subunit E